MGSVVSLEELLLPIAEGIARQEKKKKPRGPWLKAKELIGTPNPSSTR